MLMGSFLALRLLMFEYHKGQFLVHSFTSSLSMIYLKWSMATMDQVTRELVNFRKFSTISAVRIVGHYAAMLMIAPSCTPALTQIS